MMSGPEKYRFSCCNAELFSGINLFVYGTYTAIKCVSKKQLFEYLAQLLKVDPSVIATIENYPIDALLRLEIDEKGNCKIYPIPDNTDDGDPLF
jgi:hypothetical protein